MNVNNLRCVRRRGQLVPPFVLALALSIGIGACAAQGPAVRRSEQRLPLRIESIGIPPIFNAPGVTMNDSDREFLRKQIRAGLEEHPPLHTFDAAPNKLPSTAQLTARITGYRATDTTGEKIFVRTIDLEAEFELSYLGTQDPPLRFTRAYSYQHAYLPTETVATQLFDLQNATGEFSALVIAEFFPSTALDKFDAVRARDPDSGMKADVPLLVRANLEAEEGRYVKAVSLWELVLYEPNGAAIPPAFKLSRLSLGMLHDQGLPDAELLAITGLTEEGPLVYAGFREELRDLLHGASPNEDKIAEQSDYAAFRAHANLGAAHMNLANLYLAWRQLDLAVYHYGMAWAHTRAEAALEKWNQIQFDRKLIANGQANDSTLRLYLRLPPPSTSNHLPGSFDERVLPPSKVRMEGIQAQIRRASGNSAPAALEPVALPALDVQLEPLTAPAGGTKSAPAARSTGTQKPAAAATNTPAQAPPARKAAGQGPAPRQPAPAPPAKVTPADLPPPQDVPLDASPQR
jgi:hypothetical protein